MKVQFLGSFNSGGEIMDRKLALFAFNGDLMCFGHALINAIDFKEKGYDVKLIMEGSSTGLVTKLDNSEAPFHKFYHRCLKEGILDCICKACANQMETLEYAKKQGLPLGDDLYGHPSMEQYIAKGYEIITF